MKAERTCAEYLAEAASRVQAGEWSKALISADQGMALLSAENQTHCLFRLYASMALVHIGDLDRAENEVRGFLEQAGSSTVLRRLEGDGWLTLARLMQLRHRNAAELEFMLNAVATYEREGRWTQGLACRCQLAWSLLLDGLISEAAPVLEVVSVRVADHGWLDLDVDLVLTKALLWSVSGKAAAADDCCTDLLHQTKLSDAQRADVFWLLGSNALARQDVVAASDYLLEAEAAACRHWWPAQLERVEGLRNRCRRGRNSARSCMA